MNHFSITPFLLKTFISGCVLLSVGCTTPYQAFPPEVQGQVDPSVSFSQIKEAPAEHQGKIVMIGGEVLAAKRLASHTRLTILQLPLSDSQAPSLDRTQSQGRFIALQEDFLDPATVPEGTRITVIGTVSGATHEMLDEMDYTYPTITISQFHVWPDPLQPPYGRYYPYYPYGPYGYYPYSRFGPYWGPYWGHYPYW
jgi:outer membrane lipoprotein